jgi:hypothetical protein
MALYKTLLRELAAGINDRPNVFMRSQHLSRNQARSLLCVLSLPPLSPPPSPSAL